MSPADHFAARRAAFRALHASGCFILPNPWDAGTARFLAAEGFAGLATTSSGAAHARALPDGAMDLDATLAHVAEIVDATPLPVNADFGHGFGTTAEDVAAAVTRCAATGVAGLSIEDATGEAAQPLFPLEVAVARMRAARRALDAEGGGVMLVGRAECFLTGHPDPLAESLRRIAAYAEAGAEVLYVPGLRTIEQMAAVVRAAAPLPVNVLVSRPLGLTRDDIAACGVRRISVGGALAGVAWGAFAAAARALRSGSFEPLGARLPGDELNRLFG
jgi:2-methylisocitrate lyase-like PEP mutase family enzyme